ncbi:hypothetical protein QTO34_012069 [Cnephaeus nilssonii]|uniref:Uncharacterized protein n=1 Tax=Cnephaeus nilssonii TaxID=3371016 RepID=A0AA40HC59_CNENI|nr:hypothetical protein QTO34_012069 [Eptesicus nilssonii]
MDKLVMLLLLLLLGGFPFMFFQGVAHFGPSPLNPGICLHVSFSIAPATLCTVCKIFNKGKCLEGNGNCTVEEGPGCRTQDFFFISEKGGWSHEHTELDCSDHCSPSNSHHGALKIVTFCCKGQPFCNRNQGNEREYKL